jgi:hypothetical protein
MSCLHSSIIAVSVRICSSSEDTTILRWNGVGILRDLHYARYEEFLIT